MPTDGQQNGLGPAARSHLTFNVGAFSQYVFRGLTQTGGRAAVQSGADYESRSGLYAGTWLSNISWFSDANPGSYAPVEWDLCAGARRELGVGVGVDLGVERYNYPGRYGALATGVVNPNMTEIYLAASWSGASLRYSRALTNANGIEHSVGSNYLDVTVKWRLRGTALATVHAGRQTFRGRSSFADLLGTSNDALYTYEDYSAGFTAVFAKVWRASVSYSATTAADVGYVVRGRNLGSPHLTVGLVRDY